MTTQWLRRALVTVGPSGGTGRQFGDFGGQDVPALRVQFTVVKNQLATPNTAEVKVFNLTHDHFKQIEAWVQNLAVPTVVVIGAGYEGLPNEGGPPVTLPTVFKGAVKQVFYHRQENDWITTLECGDGEVDYHTSAINYSFAKGTSNSDIIHKVLSSFVGKTTKGYIDPDVLAPVLIRGMPVSGNSRQILDEICIAHSAHWSIQDHELQIVKAMGTLDTEAIEINADTGMIGAPEITMRGITVKCLLNPLLQVNGKIKLDNENIMEQVHAADMSGIGGMMAQQLPLIYRKDPDGTYKILMVIHTGDNRGSGGDWVSENLCISLQQSQGG